MISVRIDPTLENELSLVAKEKGMSKSKYLRGLIIEKLETERVHKKTPWELG
jgi:predicted DNA-binding protein